MAQNRYELDQERLATTDEHGNRVYIHPEDLTGVWKTIRLRVYWGLILLYLTLPWLRWNGQQAFLIDIKARTVHFFGMQLYAHHAPLIFFLLLGFVVMIGFITSIYGRVWCGWACPQTVFLDSIFRPIERWVEGKSRARMKLDEAPWSTQKLLKKSLKWLLFTLVSLHISHSLLGYFVGAYDLLIISTHAPSENWTLFISMLVITGIFLFDFGWFREQFCIIMCPYGRIQSIFMDENSYAVAYDEKRGEPRRGQASKDEEGDCVNCYQCVKVCPTGIDIRRGLQMECIACTACIDACDTIMERLDRPPGLIRYTTENELAGIKPKKFRPRSIIYAVLLVGISIGFFTFLNKQSGLHWAFHRGTSKPYYISKLAADNRKVVNHYKVRLNNPTGQNYKVNIQYDIELKQQGVELVAPKLPYSLSSGKKDNLHIFFKFPQELLIAGQKKIIVKLVDAKGNQILDREITLVGPIQ